MIYVLTTILISLAIFSLGENFANPLIFCALAAAGLGTSRWQKKNRPVAHLKTIANTVIVVIAAVSLFSFFNEKEHEILKVLINGWVYILITYSFILYEKRDFYVTHVLSLGLVLFACTYSTNTPQMSLAIIIIFLGTWTLSLRKINLFTDTHTKLATYKKAFDFQKEFAFSVLLFIIITLVAIPIYLLMPRFKISAPAMILRDQKFAKDYVDYPRDNLMNFFTKSRIKFSQEPFKTDSSETRDNRKESMLEPTKETRKPDFWHGQQPSTEDSSQTPQATTTRGGGEQKPEPGTILKTESTEKEKPKENKAENQLDKENEKQQPAGMNSQEPAGTASTGSGTPSASQKLTGEGENQIDGIGVSGRSGETENEKTGLASNKQKQRTSADEGNQASETSASGKENKQKDQNEKELKEEGQKTRVQKEKEQEEKEQEEKEQEKKEQKQEINKERQQEKSDTSNPTPDKKIEDKAKKEPDAGISLFDMLMFALLLLAVLLLLLSILSIFLPYIREKRKIKQAEKNNDYHAYLILIYKFASRILSLFGLRYPVIIDPKEQAALASQKLSISTSDFSAMTTLFIEARYSLHIATVTQKQKSLECYRNVIKDLKANSPAATRYLLHMGFLFDL